MNNLFNINISSKEYGFRYGCEYEREYDQITVQEVKYHGGFDTTNNIYVPVQFYSENAVTFEDGIYVSKGQTYFTKTVEKATSTTLTTIYKSNNIIYFPNFSIETYQNTPCYIFKASTFINGCEVILTQRVINRVTDAIAALKDVKLFNDRFYEQTSFKYIDPYRICYDSDWSYFRRNVCKWVNFPSGVILTDKNDEGALLYVELIPVIQSSSTTYVINEKYNGGSNSIQLSISRNNFLHSDLYIEDGSIYNEIKWNTDVDGSLSGYILDTYNKTLNKVIYNFYITNDEGFISLYDDGVVKKSSAPVWNKAQLPFNSGSPTWNDYADGLFAFCKTCLYDDSNNLILQLESDPLPLTKNNFSILVSKEAKINIDTLKQNLDYYMNYDIVNIIKNEVIQVEKPEKNDSHVVLPVFIRAKDSQNLEIFTQVTENVTINLDAYKSSVNSFILKIENIEFPEIARSPYGITFKVNGNLLPKLALSGTYYILNEERILVTTGNYKYKE